MSLRHAPTLDELLADRLVQAVMRADRVEPRQLKTLFSDVAGRIARRRERERLAVSFLATPRLEWRPQSEANDPLQLLPTPAANSCGAGICC